MHDTCIKIMEVPGFVTMEAKRAGRETEHAPPTNANTVIPLLPKTLSRISHGQNLAPLSLSISHKTICPIRVKFGNRILAKETYVGFTMNCFKQWQPDGRVKI